MNPWIRNAGKTLLQKVYSPRRFLWRLPANQSAVALTFDDGPHPVDTPALLDLLLAHNIKATFFLIGEKVAAQPDVVRRIASEGHTMGGHTWRHQEVVGLSVADLQQELVACRTVIRDVSGVDTELFRPPRGRLDFRSIRQIAALGYCLVHWTKTYSDYKRDGTARLAARFHEDPPVSRDIILLHDQEDTVTALAGVIPEWLAAGTRFDAIAS
jgi:peptidoglycan-N-acetylglucosamine deacetylase